MKSRHAQSLAEPFDRPGHPSAAPYWTASLRPHEHFQAPKPPASSQPLPPASPEP